MYCPHKSEKIAEIAVYGAVTNIYMSDFSSLEAGKWLSDRIIEWYLKYLYENDLSKANQRVTFIYSPMFFIALREKVSQNFKICMKTIPYMGINEFSSSHYHWFQKIPDFTRGVNIFEKDFIIIPVKKKNSHWYVIIICYPGLIESHQVDDDDNDKKKHPCFLVFDSSRTTNRTNDIFFLRNYLSMEYYKQFRNYKSFAENKINCYYPMVPMQTRASDCGLFMLEYVNKFFKKPIKVYPPPKNSLEDWFIPWECEFNRVILAQALKWTAQKTVGLNRLIHFPNIEVVPLSSDEDDDNPTSTDEFL